MLKALMLRKKIDEAKKALEAARAKRDELKKREAELEQDIAAASTDEENAAVEEAIDQLETEKAENDAEIQKQSEQVEQFERELQETEEKSNAAPSSDTEERAARKENTRMKAIISERARKIFGKMDAEQRMTFVSSERAKAFIEEIRKCIKEKRAISNAGLLVPEEWLGLIRENIIDYSKLYRHVRVIPLKGKGRQTIMGTVPEAVWTEACGKINELDISFADTEFDGYKVSGFIPVCNATIEDSEIDLAAEVIEVLGQAIGIAFDKAIIYGRGIKMPLGFATRLCQTEKPSDYPETARQWVDLHETNVISIPASLTGIEKYKAIVLATANAKGKYSRGEQVWVMNRKTYANIKADMLTINAAGAIVTGINDTLPVIGGIVEVLEFMPDNVIAGGYIDLYTATERAGTKLEWSSECRFTEDQTVFKGTARYDGKPVIPEAFVLIGLDGVVPTADMLFAPDDANTPVVTPVTVSVLPQTDTVYGVDVSSLQSADTMLSGNGFYGTLKYIASGEPATTWGPGYFIAIDFTGIDLTENTVRVGLTPSAGAGFVNVPADDHKSYFKVTNKEAQVLKVITTKGGNSVSEIYSLAGLTLETPVV